LLRLSPVRGIYFFVMNTLESAQSDRPGGWVTPEFLAEGGGIMPGAVHAATVAESPGRISSAQALAAFRALARERRAADTIHACAMFGLNEVSGSSYADRVVLARVVVANRYDRTPEHTAVPEVPAAAVIGETALVGVGSQQS
jgi:hypothetical protein